jgi:hypothetical protein
MELLMYSLWLFGTAAGGGIALAFFLEKRRVDRLEARVSELLDDVGVIDCTQKLLAEDVDKLENDVTNFTRKI